MLSDADTDVSNGGDHDRLRKFELSVFDHNIELEGSSLGRMNTTGTTFGFGIIQARTDPSSGQWLTARTASESVASGSTTTFRAPLRRSRDPSLRRDDPWARARRANIALGGSLGAPCCCGQRCAGNLPNALT